MTRQWGVYRVEVGWDTLVGSGTFVLGTSTIGGADRLGGTATGAALSDVSSEVKRITLTRGRDSSGAVQAGEATVVLHDSTGKYNPLNADSPLAGKLRPGRPVRVSVTVSGTTYDRFYGYIQSIASDSDYGTQEAEIHCRDLFVLLEACRPTIANTGPTTTGAAIGRVLDAISLPVASRDLDTGDAIPDFGADGSKSGLEVIAELLKAERGTFYANGAGKAVYEDRQAAWRPPRTAPQSTIATGMNVRDPGADIARVRNRATVQRTGGVAVSYRDERSVALYGVRDHAALVTPYLADDEQAQRLARWLVASSKEPVPPVRSLRINAYDAGNYQALLARELNDFVRVVEPRTQIAGDFTIEAISDDIAPGAHTCSWSLRSRAAGQAFRIGVSTLGGSDVLVY